MTAAQILNIRLNPILADGAISAAKDKIKSAVESATDALRPEKVKAFASEFTGTATAAGSATAEVKRLAGAVGDVDKGLKTAGDSGGGLFSSLKNSFKSGREEAAAGGGIFASIGSTLGNLMSPIGAVTAGVGLLVAGFTTVLDVGQKFETGMAAVGAITGLQGAPLEDIGNRAQGLAAKFGGDATTQITSFQGILSRFGADLAKYPEKLGAVSESVNIMAKAGGIDAAQAMDTLTTAMLQFGVDTSNANELASESSRFINVMAASARVGAAEIPQVGEAVKVAGVAMKGAKVSFEEGNAAIQVLAAGGKVGAEAGTALRNVLGKIAGEEVIPKDALAKLKSLGVDMKLVSDTTKPFADRLKELGKASNDATAFTQVFGSENAAAATILAKGANTVRDWTKEITGTSDATTQAAVNMNTMAERLSRAKAGLENFAIDAYKALTPVMSGVFGALADSFGLIKDAIAPVLGKLFQSMGGIITRSWDVLKPILAGVGAVLITTFVTSFSLISTGLTAAYNVVAGIFDGIVDAVKPIYTALKNAFGFTDTVSKTFDPLKTMQAILGGVTDAVSALGDILGAVGGLVVSVVVEGFKNTLATLGALWDIGKSIVGVFYDFSKETKNVGAETKTAGGFFETFVSIVKTAPAIINAVTAGFKAFMGSIQSLFTDFSFEKIKDLFSGKTVTEAFNASLNDTKQKATQKQMAELFKKHLDDLEVIKETADKTTDEKQKVFNDARFISEKGRLKEALEAKQKSGELEEEQAKELAKRLWDINLAEAKDDDVNSTAGAANKKEKKKKELKSLIEEIKKARLENAKILSDIDAKDEEDESARQRKAAAEKIQNSVQAVRDEIDKIKREKNVAEGQRIDLLKELATKEELVTKQGYADMTLLETKLIQAQVAAAKKAADDKAKFQIDAVKNAIVRTESLLKEARDADERAVLTTELGKLKAEQIGLETQQEVRALEQKNVELGAAETALIKARAVLATAVFREQRERMIGELKASETGVAFVDVSDATKQLVQDAQAQVDAALGVYDRTKAAIASTDAYIVSASKDSQDKQAKILQDAADKRKQILLDSSAFYRASLNLQLGFEKAFSDDAIAERKRLSKEAQAAIQSDEDALFQSLKNRTIDDKGYYSAQDALSKKRQDAESSSVSFLNVLNSSFIDVTKKAATEAATGATEAAATYKKLQETHSDDLFEQTAILAKQSEAQGGLYEGLAVRAGASFASLLASGKSASDSMISILADAAIVFLDAQIKVWIAGIFGTEVATLGPAGLATAALATGILTGLVQAAKASLSGAHDGVVGIKPSYSKAPSSQDVIPILVRKGESIINPDATKENHDVLEFINTTNRPAHEFYSRIGFDTPELRHDYVENQRRLQNQMKSSLERFEMESAQRIRQFDAIKQTIIAVSVMNSQAGGSEAIVRELERQTEISNKVLSENQKLRAQLRQQKRTAKSGKTDKERTPQTVKPQNYNW